MITKVEGWHRIEYSDCTDTGFRYRANRQEVKNTIELEYKDTMDLFEQFYELNRQLKYCNGCYYKFVNKEIEKEYLLWVKSEDFKSKLFRLEYKGIVD